MMYRETGQDVHAEVSDALDLELVELESLVERLEGLVDDHYSEEAVGDLLREVLRKKANAWVQHTDLRDVVRPDSSTSVRTYLRVSWVVVCRYHIMMQQLLDMRSEKRGFEMWPSCFLKKADDFAFVDAMKTHRKPIALSPDPIGAYSVRVLMAASSLLCETLDEFGWTPSASDYLRVLSLRYALIVHRPLDLLKTRSDLGQWEASLPTPDDEEATDIEDPVAEEEMVADPTQQPEPLLAPAPLCTSFLDTGELLFFHHLWRDHCLLDFYTSLERPLSEGWSLIQRRAQWRLTQGIPALRKIMYQALKADAFGNTAIEKLKDFYPSRLIWPGEREKMMFVYPQEAGKGDPHTILYRLRGDQLTRVQLLMKFEATKDGGQGDAFSFVQRYLDQEAAVARFILERPHMKDKTESQWLDSTILNNRLGVDHERIVLLLFEILFDLRLQIQSEGQCMSKFAQNSYVDDRTLERSRARPPYTRSNFQRSVHDDWPLFGAVWYNYLLAAPSRAVIPATPHLVDALSGWFSLAMHHKASILEPIAFCKDGPWKLFLMPLDLLSAH